MTWAASSASDDFERANERVIRRNQQRRHLEAMGLPPGVFGRHGLDYRRRKDRRRYIRLKAQALGITEAHADRITPRMPYRPRRQPSGNGAVRRSLTFTTAESIR